ncbi:MAG: nucleotidyltransferase domain-containing protein [Acidobacteria bacterium]|nr:nucleotidyltransferase domain-containing protein [Acidobacteriota bacterium]
MTSDTHSDHGRGHRQVEPERLAAAVDAVAERYDPDQIILFGSAAPGEMRDYSDIDLLLIGDHGHPATMCREKMRLDGDRIDVVRMRREDIERHRRTAATLPESALREGWTVLLKRDSPQAVATGESWFTDATGTVTSRKLRPDQSMQFLERGRRKWITSNSPEIDDESRCELRHEAVNTCLRGLILAQGRIFDYFHKLEELWDAAESDGEAIPAPRDDAILERLAGYARELMDDREVDPEVDSQMLADSEELVRKVVAYSREAIPRMTRDTNAALAKTPRIRKPTPPAPTQGR